MERRDVSPRFRAFSAGLLLYVMAVVLWGAYVRASGSGAGCGDHWPACNGEIIPHLQRKDTLIEWAHRLTSGLAWLGALVLMVWARRFSDRRVRLFAALSFALMCTEALVGAGLVLFKMVAQNQSVARAVWMASHLCNTFFLLGMLSATLWCARFEDEFRIRARWKHGALIALSLVGVLFLGVSGAIAALGDTLFPAISLQDALQQDVGATHFLLRLRLFHPLIAWFVGGGVLVAVLSSWFVRNRRVRRMSLWVLAVFALQAGVGFLNVLLLAPIWLQLTHLFLADVLWIALVFLWLASLTETCVAHSMSSSEAIHSHFDIVNVERG